MVTLELLAGGALALGAAASAAAQAPVHVRLAERQLPGAERCVAATALRGAVAVLLGYDPFDDRASRAIEVEVRPRTGGYEAQVTLHGDDGRALGDRRLTAGAGECDALTDALALAIGNAIDPLRLSQPPAAHAALAPPFSPASTATRAETLPAPSSRPALLGSLGILGAVGAAPTVSGGAQLEVELRWPGYSLSLGGRADLPASMGYQGGSISSQLLVGQAVPCLRIPPFGACLLAALGSELAQASGLPGATQQSALYVAGGARVSFDILAARPVGLRAALDLLAPITREDFLVGSAIAFTTPALAVALSLSGVVQIL